MSARLTITTACQLKDVITRSVHIYARYFCLYQFKKKAHPIKFIKYFHSAGHRAARDIH